MIHDVHAVSAVFIGGSYGCMVGQWNLGIRDDPGRDEGMRGPAEGALDPADNEGDLSHRVLYRAGIVPVPDKAAVMAAGAAELSHLKGIHDRVIKIL